MKTLNKSFFAESLEKELDDINNFLNEITNNFFNIVLYKAQRNVSLVFDDEAKPICLSNMESLKNLIDQLNSKYEDYDNSDLNDFKRVLNHLKRLDNEGICGEGIYFPLFDKRREKYDEDALKDMELLKRSILSANYGYYVSGSYNHSTKTITLYTNNIPFNYSAYLSVFVHEYFHALCFFMLDYYSSDVKIDKYYKEVVFESLATYFQIKYLFARGFVDDAKNIKERIQKYSPIFFPYSGCKDLFTYREFIEVLEISFNRIDFRDALYNLVTGYDAEIILQCNKNKRIEQGISNNHFIMNFPFNFYLLKHDENYNDELANSYSIADKNIKKGDILMHVYLDKIVALSIAKTNSYYDNKKDDYFVKCDYDLLDNPIDAIKLIDKNYMDKCQNFKVIDFLNKIVECNPLNSLAYLLLKSLYK